MFGRKFEIWKKTENWNWKMKDAAMPLGYATADEGGREVIQWMEEVRFQWMREERK